MIMIMIINNKYKIMLDEFKSRRGVSCHHCRALLSGGPAPILVAFASKQQTRRKRSRCSTLRHLGSGR